MRWMLATVAALYLAACQGTKPGEEEVNYVFVEERLVALSISGMT